MPVRRLYFPEVGSRRKPAHNENMVCPERWRLLAVYQRKVRVYTLAVSDVRVCHELEVGAEEYAKLRHETLSTFADCDAAFQALHRHHASHKCLGA